MGLSSFFHFLIFAYTCPLGSKYRKIEELWQSEKKVSVRKNAQRSDGKKSIFFPSLFFMAIKPVVFGSYFRHGTMFITPCFFREGNRAVNR